MCSAVVLLVAVPVDLGVGGGDVEILVVMGLSRWWWIIAVC